MTAPRTAAGRAIFAHMPPDGDEVQIAYISRRGVALVEAEARRAALAEAVAAVEGLPTYQTTTGSVMGGGNGQPSGPPFYRMGDILDALRRLGGEP